MKLVTFHSRSREDRIGAVAADGTIVDLNAACALYLRNVQREGAFYALADARVPSNMRELFENGDRGLDAARTALDYVMKEGAEAGPLGESLRFQKNEVKIKAPIAPKKFFHTAGNFREHHEEAQKSGFSHPVLPWIVFFSKRGRNHWPGRGDRVPRTSDAGTGLRAGACAGVEKIGKAF